MLLLYFIVLFIAVNKVCGQFVGIGLEKRPMMNKSAAGAIKESKKCKDVASGIVDTLIPDNLTLSKDPQRVKRRAVPDTLYLEVFVIIDEKLSEAVGKSYSNGYWNKYGQNQLLPLELHTKEKSCT
eukprot:TRINITY_DN32658_c0_g1_i1.p1 TRINITY_DN32658_c0_g1~~TRINITY_DN32658_c0_g1_i1.p1  ORF type:complete len:126 (+),score=22.14 TRINITY_DN32658_c0_g1_i1:99-476(+)